MITKKTGVFLLSLDFEALWGAIGGLNKNEFNSFYNHVKDDEKIVNTLLEVFAEYNIHATWATVGAMLCNNKEEALQYVRNDIYYPKWDISIKQFISNIQEPSLFFMPNLVRTVASVQGQEIGSHTFSHYYGNELGVSDDLLKQEIESSKLIFSKEGYSIKSLIMPRNQVENLNTDILTQNGIIAVRGRNHSPKRGALGRVINFLDSYLPIFQCTYALPVCPGMGIVDLKASLFFRSFFKKLRVLEGLKLWRIKTAMTQAAKKGECFHLWFHPHNLGNNLEYNITTLKKIFKHYHNLSIKYGLQSLTMAECIDYIKEY